MSTQTQMMSPFLHRLRVAVVWTLVVAAAWAQGVPCTSPIVPQPRHPIYPPATLPTLDAYVDPVAGDDASASVGGTAFRTIKAATVALSQVVAVPNQMGAVVLLPGRYGYDPTDPSYNGEIWPVEVEPGIRIEGVNALNVIIDGSKQHPLSQHWMLPSPATGNLVFAVPCFVYGSARLYGYTHTLLNRVTIVDADVGVLITGSGEVDPTIAECLFMNCAVGAQVHSQGDLVEGVHKPRFLWCTFGNCDIGLACTGEFDGNVSPHRGFPAVVNALFKCDIDMEGVSCAAVTSSAFATARCNTSPLIPQPAVRPQPLFDLDDFTHEDLFVGAQYVSSPMASQEWFTDWRLTHVTHTPPVVPNPANAVGIVGFPATTPNGTNVDVVFADYSLGIESAEGAGTYGPLSNPYGGSSGHLGYRSGGTFIAGGTVPGERRYGLGMNGVMFDSIDLTWPPGAPPFLLGIVAPGRLWRSGQRHPEGIESAALHLTGQPVVPGGPLWAGDFFLDIGNYEPAPAPYQTMIPPTALGSHSVSIGLGSLGPAPLHFVMQLAWLDAIGNVVLGDAQAFVVQ